MEASLLASAFPVCLSLTADVVEPAVYCNLLVRFDCVAASRSRRCHTRCCSSLLYIRCWGKVSLAVLHSALLLSPAFALKHPENKKKTKCRNAIFNGHKYAYAYSLKRMVVALYMSIIQFNSIILLYIIIIINNGRGWHQ